MLGSAIFKSLRKKDISGAKKIEAFAYGWYLKNTLKISLNKEGRKRIVWIGKDPYSLGELKEKLRDEKVNVHLPDAESSIFNWAKDDTIVPEKETFEKLYRAFRTDGVTEGSALLSFKEFFEQPLLVMEKLHKYAKKYFNKKKGKNKKRAFTEEQLIKYQKELAQQVFNSKASTEEEKRNVIKYLFSTLTLFVIGSKSAYSKQLILLEMRDFLEKADTISGNITTKNLIKKKLTLSERHLISNHINMIQRLIIYFRQHYLVFSLCILCVIFLTWLSYWHIEKSYKQKTFEEVAIPSFKRQDKVPSPKSFENTIKPILTLFGLNECSERKVSKVYEAEELVAEIELEKDNARMVQNLTKAIKLDSTFSYAYYKLGGIYMKENNYQLSLIEYSNAVKYDPDNSYYHLFRGISNWLTGNDELALKDLNNSLENFSDSSECVGFRQAPWVLKGYINFGLKNFEDAKESFEVAISLAPTFPQMRQYLAYTYDALGDFENAISSAQTALILARDSLSRDDIYGLYGSLALFYLKLASPKTNKSDKTKNKSYRITHLEKAILYADSAAMLSPNPSEELAAKAVCEEELRKIISSP